MNELSGLHNGKWLWIPAGAVKIGRIPDRRLLSDTNIGAPGRGVSYASLEPSCDQSHSATPSKYGFGCPPNVGTAHTLMSLVLDPSRLRAQNVTKAPSGENPKLRISGLARSGAPPRVRL